MNSQSALSVVRYFPIFDSVRRECAIQSQRLEKKIRNPQISTWDHNAINAEQSSLDEVMDSIKAIASTNAFARIWHSQARLKGTQFLRELFGAVSAIPPSADLQFDPETIPFPSSWEFDLQAQGNRLLD